MNINLSQEYKDIYDCNPEYFFFAPGRVNLIGEHTDYNGGHVFPCALSMGIYCVCSKRKDNLFSFTSLSFPEQPVLETKIHEKPNTDGNFSWSEYPIGMFVEVVKRFGELPFGLNIMYYSDLPVGSGLSSSAALEVVTGLMLKEVYNLQDFEKLDIVRMAHYVENNYIGNKCGIMDQYASCMGEKSTALFLDTATLRCEKIPVELGDYALVIINSNVPHNLAASEYNVRRTQCEEALRLLQKSCDIKALCEIEDMDFFEKHSHLIKDETLLKRARHVISENIRTIEAVKAFEDDDLKRFGELMRQSHESLRDDYEVSCKEMDILTSLAWDYEGVIGSRMTGGGFGGSTVNIVQKTCVEDFSKYIRANYFLKTGFSASIYLSEISDGAHVCKP